MDSHSQPNTSRNSSFYSSSSSSSLKDLLKGFSCEVCLEKFNDDMKKPLSLPCGHTFCSFCIKKFKNQCPTCRTSFQESQVKKNFALAGLLNELGREELLAQKREEEKCLIHKREIDRFCKSCLKLMCSVCYCQHLGSANIISDVGLKSDIKDIQKSMMETQTQEKVLKEKINIGFQMKVKKIEDEEAQSRQEVSKILERETSQIHSEEDKLVLQAEEDAKQKIKQIEDQKQKVIQEVKKGTKAKIEEAEARHKVSLAKIASKTMNELTPIKEKGRQILQKMQVFTDSKQVPCDTLAECANVYQLWEQKRSQITEILMLKNDSPELLFDKLQESTQERGQVERNLEDFKIPQEHQGNPELQYLRFLKFLEGFYVGEDVDFCEKDGTWVNAHILDITPDYLMIKTNKPVKNENKRRVNSESALLPLDSARIIKRWKKGGDFQINNLIDVIDPMNKWCIGRVLSFNEEKILIHFEGMSTEYDDWILKDSAMIAELGTFTQLLNL